VLNLAAYPGGPNSKRVNMQQQDVGLDENAVPTSGVGNLLRDARLRKGMAIEDVARQLRIRQPYLKAIELGDFSQLPGSTYATGFVRAFADLVDLDSREILRQFKNEADGGFMRRSELVFPSPVTEGGRLPGGAFLFMGLILCVLTYGGWYWLSSSDISLAELVPDVPERLSSLLQRDPEPEAATTAGTEQGARRGAARTGDIVPPSEDDDKNPAASPPPAPAPAPVPAPAVTTSPAVTARPAPAPATAPPPPAAAPAAAPAPAAQGASAEPRVYGQENRNSRVTLKAKEEAWVQVRDVTGNLLLARLLRKGETFLVPNRTDLTLMTGNAGALEVQLDGKALPPLGPSGTVKRDVPLDPEKLGKLN
jgi:cytoskeleton protein RodZ